METFWAILAYVVLVAFLLLPLVVLSMLARASLPDAR